jgi:cytochrome c553
MSTQPVVAQLPVGNPQEGMLLFATCRTCHGNAAQGNQQMRAPALANSDDWYLYRQLMNFKKNVRGYLKEDTLGMQMAATAKTLNDSMAVSDLVAYIKTLPEVVLLPMIQGDIKKGERIYQSICGSCHGAGAKGNEKMNSPRLSGLNDWYIKEQIHKFKKSIRGAHSNDSFGAQMIPMVASLTNEQVNDVIAYICSATQKAK